MVSEESQITVIAINIASDVDEMIFNEIYKSNFMRKKMEKMKKREHKLNQNGLRKTYLQQRRAQHGHEETLVEEVEKLIANQRMRNLHHRVAELQRIHEQRQLRHLVDIIGSDAKPVDGLNLDGVGKRGVKPAQARHEHRRHRRMVGDVRPDVRVLLRQRHAQQKRVARLMPDGPVAVHVRD